MHITVLAPLRTDSGLKQLLDELHEVIEWFELGIHLGVPPHELSKIEREGGGIDACKRKMLSYWLKNSQDVSWEALKRALFDMSKHDNLARNLKKTGVIVKPEMKQPSHEETVAVSEQGEMERSEDAGLDQRAKLDFTDDNNSSHLVQQKARFKSAPVQSDMDMARVELKKSSGEGVNMNCGWQLMVALLVLFVAVVIVIVTSLDFSAFMRSSKSAPSERIHDRPEMQEFYSLKSAQMSETINIIERIGADYKQFGTLLLQDKTGQKISSFESKFSEPSDINAQIFREWLKGSGLLPVAWATLVRTLRDAKMITLADDIIAALLNDS